MNDNYTPYGDEWKAEMMKLRKPDIVEMLKKSLQRAKDNPPPSVDLHKLEIETWEMDATRNLPIGVTTNDGKKWNAVIRFIPANA